MTFSLNPCFSGTYSRRPIIGMKWILKSCLNPCFSGTYSRRNYDWFYRFLQKVLILVLVEHTLGEQLLQRTLFQSITLVNSEYLSVFNRKNVPLTLQRYEIFGETRALKRENIIILRP